MLVIFGDVVVTFVNALPFIAGSAPVSVVAFSVPFALSTSSVGSGTTTSIGCVEPLG